MTGETNLNKLLASLSPELVDGEFVFCTFAHAGYGDHVSLQPIAAFLEGEGLTLVVPLSIAQTNRLKYETVLRCISLKVHSSLEAVGLTAAFSAKLTDHGISANVIAGFYHDHIFVPDKSSASALAALEELSTLARQ